MAIVDMVLSDKTKERIAEWFLSQGIPSILLCAVLAFMGYCVIELVPVHLDMIQEGYDRNANELGKAFDQQIEAHERERSIWLQMVNDKEAAK